MIFNAAKNCKEMFQLFEDHHARHYSYLHATCPHLIPHLPQLSKTDENILQNLSGTQGAESSYQFLSSTFERIRNIVCSENCSSTAQISILEMSMK